MTFEPAALELAPGVTLPSAIRRRLASYHSQSGVDRWLEGVPAVIDTWRLRWEIDLEPGEPLDAMNLVLFGHSRPVGDVVLKLSVPSFETRAELAATRLASGSGFVRLLDADPDACLIMTGRIHPGGALRDSELTDDEMTRICARKLLEFWQEPAPETDLIPLDRWARDLLDHDPERHPRAPNDLLLEARDIAHDLLGSPTSRSLLHGDLHHQNILRGRGDTWVTIDPKGLIGERGYDITAWMMNPWGAPLRDDYVDIANRRLDVFAEMLGEDRNRLAQWAVFHAALSLCWSLDAEQPEDPEGDIAFLQSMVRLLD